MSRYKDNRLDALVAKEGLFPEQVRNLLLATGDTSSDILVVDAGTALKGKITEDDALTYSKHCCGRFRLPPEEDLPGEESALPDEITEGLWFFPPTAEGAEDLKVDAVLQLDEVLFDDLPEVRLNDRPKDDGSAPRPLGELSPGQRCSAILPILLLNGTCPLIIDQPEDNLDNRLIRQVIVNILASMKLRRQVIIATHNPNLPVLGDVEQAVILRAVEEKSCSLEVTGGVDESDVVRHITDVMEGGREAFQYRHTIYSTHWKGPVEQSTES